MRARIILLLVACVALSWTARGADDTAWGVRVVVLDAGHGGNDPGACYGGVREKDLTLKVVTRLGKMIQEQMQRESVPWCGKLAKKPDAAAGSTLFLPHFGIWVLQ